jgi:hypothetical protein
MNQEIQSRFEDLEKRRVALTSLVLALTPEQQQAHPDPKAFSPAETLEHFALAEQFNLSFLQKTPPSTLAGKKASARFGYKFALDGLQKAAHVMQPLPVMCPKGTVIAASAAKKWEGVRALTEKYLDKVTNPDAAFAKMLFFFGTLSANDYLALMEAHMSYHEKRFPKV